MDLLRSVGVAEILEGNAFDTTYADRLLAFAEGLDWSGRPDLTWFIWSQRCTLPMPFGVEAETSVIEGDAAPAMGDAPEAVQVLDTVDLIASGNVNTVPADGGVALARSAATGAAKSVTGNAVPARGGSNRVGSIQSDTLRGVAQERCDLREPPLSRDFRPESPAHQRGD